MTPTTNAEMDPHRKCETRSFPVSSEPPPVSHRSKLPICSGSSKFHRWLYQPTLDVEYLWLHWETRFINLSLPVEAEPPISELTYLVKKALKSLCLYYADCFLFLHFKARTAACLTTASEQPYRCLLTITITLICPIKSLFISKTVLYGVSQRLFWLPAQWNVI